ncbi:hypothetical protein GXM_10301 [Nostoc sphaeroides CCNUC1]|uniref:Uncharacterized protein n=1 Tax=Nostoc sphaeroides CCNUC1 TaxID=2653204 RepID=A0A5P8WK60_9NOSO|nr:hypothetical protein GXM_10301 [Nostoc sphaeroides CCNUC1]
MFFGDITYLIWDKNCKQSVLISLALAWAEKKDSHQTPNK